MCLIGIDIGGTNFRIGAVEEDGSMLQFRKVKVGEVFHTPNALADLTAYLRDYFAALAKEGRKPSAIAIGFPATLDRERQTVLQAPNVAFMEHLPVVKTLTRELGIPVYIERDVCMAFYYDKEKYGLPDGEVLIGCYFGTGIGNVVCIGGRPLCGHNGTAGELGHIPVDGSSQPCGCGNKGCMENLAGGKYLARLCREVYLDTPIDELFVRHANEPLLLEFVDRMACTVATEVNILDPDYVLIGGGVPCMKGFPAEYLRERIRVHARKPYPAENLRIIFTEDEEQKCVIGATRYLRAICGAGASAHLSSKASV